MARKKISGTADFIIPLGVLALLGYGLYKLGVFGNSGGGAGNPDATASAGAQSLTALAAQGQKPSLTTSQLEQMANSIYEFLLESPPDQDSVVEQVEFVNNTADVVSLVNQFGNRKAQSLSSVVSDCYIIGLNCPQYTMGGLMHAVMDDDHIAEINQFFVDNGINYSI